MPEQQQQQNINPANLAQLQALYDLLQYGFNKDTTLKEAIQVLVKDALEEGEMSPELKAVWNLHQYPDKAIKFIQVSTYNHCPQLHEASTEAQALFFLMLRLQHKMDGYVAVKKGIFAKALNLGSKRARRMQDYLDELLSLQVISKVHEAPKGSTAPSIYKINDKFAKIGKGFIPQPIKQDKDYHLQYSQTYEKIRVELPHEAAKEYICGTLEGVLNFTKKRASATNTDSTEPISEDSSIQDNHN